MQNTSSAFKTAIKAPARELKIRGLIEAPDNSVYPLAMTDLAQGSFSYKAACMEHDFSLGGATAASCTLVLTNYDKQWDDVDLEGGKLTVYCGVVTGYEVPEPDEPEEEMPEPEPVPIVEDVLMGTFVIDRQSRPYATITLSAADRLILLDKPLADVPGVIYPVTARTLLTAISGACNVPLDNSLLNIDELDEIDLHEPEYDGVTCRDVLGEIALLCGGFARCTREGAIEIVRITQPKNETAYTITKNDRFSFKETTETITLTGLKYGDTLIGDEGYILEVERLYMMPEDLALTHLQALWMDFEGFTYTPCTAQYKGNPAIDTGDPIRHVTREDKDVLTFVGKHTFTFGGRCSVDSYGKSASEQKYISANERRLSGLVAGITHDFDQKLSDYEQASAQMSDLIGLMMGVHPTQDPQPDGSTIYYWHDQPTLEESLIIWRLDKNAFAVSSDGGTTWTGQTSDGTVIARTVHALDIRAEQILLSDGTTYLTTALADVNDDIRDQNDAIADIIADASISPPEQVELKITLMNVRRQSEELVAKLAGKEPETTDLRDVIEGENGLIAALEELISLSQYDTGEIAYDFDGLTNLYADYMEAVEAALVAIEAIEEGKLTEIGAGYAEFIEWKGDFVQSLELLPSQITMFINGKEAMVLEQDNLSFLSEDYKTKISIGKWEMIYDDKEVMSIDGNKMQIPRVVTSEYLGVGGIKFVPAMDGNTVIGTNIVLVDDPAEI